MNSKKLLAFTLIELLVVIAIVGILSGFVLVSLNSATDSANDARRKSDLSQIVKALLVYNTSNPTYPIETCSIGSTCSATVNNALGQASGITGPNNTYYTYSSIDGTSFTVSTIMSDTDIYSYDSETGYSKSPAEPGLPGYAKRQPITINSASALTDYQVKLTITYDSDMQPDFDDLRFTSADGTTELSYWLESKTDSTTAIVWVKVPSLASGDNTLYMYYANASATTASNGDNTFEFFDDFSGESVNVDKWTNTGCAVSGGVLTMPSSSAGAQAIVGKIVFNEPVIVEINIKFQVNSTGNSFNIGFSSGAWSPLLVFAPRASGTGCRGRAYNSSNVYTSDITTTYPTVNFERWRVDWIDNSTGKFWVNGVYKQTISATEVLDNNVTVLMGCWIDTTSNLNIYSNLVFVRKYTTMEPTSSFGAEQSI